MKVPFTERSFCFVLSFLAVWGSNPKADAKTRKMIRRILERMEDHKENLVDLQRHQVELLAGFFQFGKRQLAASGQIGSKKWDDITATLGILEHATAKAEASESNNERQETSGSDSHEHLCSSPDS